MQTVLYTSVYQKDPLRLKIMVRILIRQLGLDVCPHTNCLLGLLHLVSNMALCSRRSDCLPRQDAGFLAYSIHLCSRLELPYSALG